MNKESKALYQERVGSPIENLPQELVVSPSFDPQHRLTVMDSEIAAFVPVKGHKLMQDWVRKSCSGGSELPITGIWGNTPAESNRLMMVFGTYDEIEMLAGPSLVYELMGTNRQKSQILVDQSSFGPFVAETIRIGLVLNQQAMLIAIHLPPKPKLRFTLWLR
ncbi:hypothetical protein [Roseofilum capinflatum]|uniref:Uncharacterized protein n=1 Tax=Roseofilum capinflatum BLCC-M114 TaxID=3022440 RepID=A0ABT7B203_9CYAN|nr:hypothetical protein [Roseofilum capinflatum]MDJ1173192.1 hypothetical protein [Roseofilum capinflatum BLCC-M114]